MQAKSCTCVTFVPYFFLPPMPSKREKKRKKEKKKKKKKIRGWRLRTGGRKQEGRNALELEERGKKRSRFSSFSLSLSLFLFLSLSRGTRLGVNESATRAVSRGECIRQRFEGWTMRRDDAGERRIRGSVTLRQCDREHEALHRVTDSRSHRRTIEIERSFSTMTRPAPRRSCSLSTENRDRRLASRRSNFRWIHPR